MTATVIIRTTASGYEYLDTADTDTGFQPGLPDVPANSDSAAPTCIVLLPTEQVFLGSTSIASRNRKQLQQAVPYALEEQLAEDPETLHFTIEQVAGEDRVQVAAVSRVLLSSLLEDLGTSGIEITHVVPDALLLPWREGEISVLIDSGRALVRFGACAASAIEVDILDSWLALLIGSMEPRPEAVCLYGANAAASSVDWPLQTTARNQDESTAAIITSGITGSALNLLQGEFAARTHKDQAWPWRWPAIAAAVAATLAVLVSFTELQNLKSGSARLDAAIQSRFHESFPQVQRLQDPIIQAERELRRLRGGAAAVQSDFIHLLSGVAGTISANPGLTLKSLSYRNRQMQLELEATSIDELENLQRVAESAGLDARLQSARLGADGVSGTLTLAGAPS